MLLHNDENVLGLEIGGCVSRTQAGIISEQAAIDAMEVMNGGTVAFVYALTWDCGVRCNRNFVGDVSRLENV